VDPYQSLALINCRYTAYRVPQAKPEQSYKLPVRVMVYNKIHSADDPWYDERADTAHPLLLDLPEALWKGGHDADKHVAGKVVAALAAYRKPGVPSRALNRCFTLQRCCKSAQSSIPDPSAYLLVQANLQRHDLPGLVQAMSATLPLSIQDNVYVSMPMRIQ
jgi:hypothetical protein